MKAIHLYPLFIFVLHASGQVAISPDAAAPDAGAMLDIRSTDKGLLIPRLDQAQMEALGSPETPPPTGLWVFNTTANGFFFFDGTAWVGLGDAGPDGDDSTTNELQELTTQGAVIVLRRKGLELDPAAQTFRTEDLDADPGDEEQNLGISSTGTGRSLTISGGSGVSFSVEDNDNDPANELQTLARSGTTLSLSQALGSFSLNDNDTDPANELQTLGQSRTGDSLQLSITNGGSTTIDLSDPDASSTNELDSKWSVNGTRIHFNDGNVGIGWPVPAQKLDVSGRLRMRGGSPGVGKVLAAQNTNGDAIWAYPPTYRGTLSDQTEDFVTNKLRQWEEVGLPAEIDGVRPGERLLVIVSFRCSLKGQGNGSDDFSFRIGARKSTTGAMIWFSRPTGWIETIDQHRDHWHAIQFHRVMEIDQSGFVRFYLEVDVLDSDDRLYVDDLHFDIIRL